jgi:ubiquinone/menaquinone biosynthesis C-methylase UbiE
MQKKNERSSKNHKDTSWQPVAGWYDSLVGDKGSYYHEKLVIPGVINLLKNIEHKSILDLGCGQGIFGRSLGNNIAYQGVDLSKTLVDSAKIRDNFKNHQYIVGDIAKKLPVEKNDFDVATCILALQNVTNPDEVIKIASMHLRNGGHFILVLNHPCFRIPRQSAWGIDEKQNVQYRRITRYLSAMKIPVATHPGRGKDSPVTWSSHFSLSDLSNYLETAGFLIEKIEEWKSDKKSQGSAAARENRSREEIPLFMTIKAIKSRAV